MTRRLAGPWHSCCITWSRSAGRQLGLARAGQLLANALLHLAYPRLRGLRLRLAEALLAVLALSILTSCKKVGEVLSQLPLVVPDAASWTETAGAKVIEATITQAGGALASGLAVRCEVSFALPPGHPQTVRSLPAARLDGNRFRCDIGASARAPIRNNHLLIYEWFVEGLGANGQMAILGRSGLLRHQVGCDQQTASAFLRNMQGTVVSAFGGTQSLSQIQQKGYAPTHFTHQPFPLPPLLVQRVFKGMGVAFARRDDLPAASGLDDGSAPRVDSPNLLLFVPARTVPGHDSLAAHGTSYSLIGWAYTATLTRSPIDQPPQLGCIPLHEWFMHEAGVHTKDGGFAPRAGATVPGARHDRLWDLHVWFDASGTPRLGMFNFPDASSGAVPGGYEAPVGSFFYPSFHSP